MSPIAAIAARRREKVIRQS